MLVLMCDAATRDQRSFRVAERITVHLMRKYWATNEATILVVGNGIREERTLAENGPGHSLGELGTVYLSRVDNTIGQVYFAIDSEYHVRRSDLEFDPSAAAQWKRLPKQTVRWGTIRRAGEDVTPLQQRAA